MILRIHSPPPRLSIYDEPSRKKDSIIETKLNNSNCTTSISKSEFLMFFCLLLASLNCYKWILNFYVCTVWQIYDITKKYPLFLLDADNSLSLFFFWSIKVRKTKIINDILLLFLSFLITKQLHYSCLWIKKGICKINFFLWRIFLVEIVSSPVRLTVYCITFNANFNDFFHFTLNNTYEI